MKMRERNFSIDYLLDGQFKNYNEETESENFNYNEFLSVGKAYKEDKKVWLNKSSTQNILIGYLNDNKG
jgi:hypothetical protein